VTSERQWRAEWEVLRADRDRARRAWRSAADGLAARARDPLGVGRLVRDHPVAAGGVGAAVAALLARSFLRGARAPRDGADAPASPWSTILRDAALSVGVPWLVRYVKDKFGWDLAPADDAVSRNGAPSASKTPSAADHV